MKTNSILDSNLTQFNLNSNFKLSNQYSCIKEKRLDLGGIHFLRFNWIGIHDKKMYARSKSIMHRIRMNKDIIFLAKTSNSSPSLYIPHTYTHNQTNHPH